jgi:hypothetical protein
MSRELLVLFLDIGRVLLDGLFDLEELEEMPLKNRFVLRKLLGKKENQ